MKLKKPEEITKLNFNDLAFFTNKSTSDAKWDMATYFYSSEEDLENNMTKSGVPKIGVNDFVLKSDFETKIKSVSYLDGKNSIDHIIETYNKGIPMDRLIVYSESKPFIKALKFTGKHCILSDILNKEQLLKLQRTWLLKNTYMKNRWSEKCIKFIDATDWAIDFLEVNMIYADEIQKQRDALNN